MSADSSSSVGNVALVVSGTGGVVAAVNEYAVIIGLTLTFISIVIGLVFHVRADRWRRQESAEYRAELTRQILQEVQQSQDASRTESHDHDDQEQRH